MERYLDFDLRFTKNDEGYSADIVESPGGKGSHAFRLPFQEHEIENYLLKIGQRRAGMRKADSPENRAAQEFGSKLYQAVFQGDLQTAFRKSLDATRAGGSGLRIRLRLEGTPELADLPWEYLYHSQRREFLALSAETPVVRYFDLPETVKPLAVTPPLRVLVMLSNPSDVDCLDIEREWGKLKEAVKDLEERKMLVVERMDKATLGELLGRLRKKEYHVFHFVGHGSFDPQTQESVLALEDDNGRKRLVSGPELGIYLRDEPSLRLVILNACEGARASRHDPFSGAAQSLVLKGIPAVIAMQFEVSDDAAITLASGFYSALADDYPVDAALAEARKAVFAAGSTVEWGTPVLYLRAPDGRIFEVDKAAREKLHEEAKQQGKLAPIPPPLPPVRPESGIHPEREKIPPVMRSDGRRPRRWVWLLSGVVITMATLIALGAWMNSGASKYNPPPIDFLSDAGVSLASSAARPPFVQLGAPTYSHNVSLTSANGPVNGMQITVPVSALHAANKTMQVVANFSFANGPPLMANSQEPLFHDAVGRVATGTLSRVLTSDNEGYTPQSMTIPYYALNRPATNGATTYHLSFVVVVYLNSEVATQSAPVFFTFQW